MEGKKEKEESEKGEGKASVGCATWNDGENGRTSVNKPKLAALI